LLAGGSDEQGEEDTKIKTGRILVHHSFSVVEAPMTARDAIVISVQHR
jgi:hypothetical protein